MLEFVGFSPWINGLLFVVAAMVVWWAGTRLSECVDVLAERTGLGHVFAGAVLLGGATSLPEIATTLTAAASGAMQLAGTNIFGGIVMQIAVLAAVDALALRKQALTTLSPQPALLNQGVLLILLSAVAAAGVFTGELIVIGGVGMWPVLLAVAYVACLWMIRKDDSKFGWTPKGEAAEPSPSARARKESHEHALQKSTTRRLWTRFALAAVAVLAGGFVVARTGEALAEQTGLGQGFMGATLVALATSLPEVSTTWTAVRLGAYGMAAANILGTNALEFALFLPAELIYDGPPVFDTLEPTAGFLAALSIIVTCLYLWGMLERRDRTVLGMGIDSAAVLVVYAAGLATLYYLEVVRD